MIETATLEAHFQAMARNNLWSNHRVYRACSGLAEEEYRRDHGAFFHSIHGTLNHILLIDRWYIGRLQGRDLAWTRHDEELHADLPALARAQRESDRELVGLCEGLDRRGLEREVATGTARHLYRDPVHAVLAHLFLHQIHHRGQVHQMLSAAGVAPPQLDEFLLSGDTLLRAAEVEELGIGARSRP